MTDQHHDLHVIDDRTGEAMPKNSPGRHSVPTARKMTTRARWYLTIAATRHALIAVLMIVAPGSFQSPNFAAIKDTAQGHLWLWGVVFLGAGVACFAGAVTRRPRVARLGLMWSATSTLMCAAGFCLAMLQTDGFVAPVGAIMFAAVAAKDFTVCADPLRSPFEEWVDAEIDNPKVKGVPA